MDEILLMGKESGKITITVYDDVKTGKSFFYLLPDSAKLIPIVDVIDEALQNIKQ